MFDRSTKWRMVGLPCGQFHGESSSARWLKTYMKVFAKHFKFILEAETQIEMALYNCTHYYLTFCISFLLRASPIIIELRQALEASIARTLDGRINVLIEDKHISCFSSPHSCWEVVNPELEPSKLGSSASKDTSSCTSEEKYEIINSVCIPWKRPQCHRTNFDQHVTASKTMIAK